MAKKQHFHCIQFQFRGQEFTSTRFLPYEATIRSMVTAFYLLLIDEGRPLAEVTNVQFSIDEKPLIGASSAQFLFASLPPSVPPYRHV